MWSGAPRIPRAPQHHPYLPLPRPPSYPPSTRSSRRRFPRGRTGRMQHRDRSAASPPARARMLVARSRRSPATSPGQYLASGVTGDSVVVVPLQHLTLPSIVRRVIASHPAARYGCPPEILLTLPEGARKVALIDLVHDCPAVVGKVVAATSGRMQDLGGLGEQVRGPALCEPDEGGGVVIGERPPDRHGMPRHASLLDHLGGGLTNVALPGNVGVTRVFYDCLLRMSQHDCGHGQAACQCQRRDQAHENALASHPQLPPSTSRRISV